ncbi:LysR family substrate-binding domain-containing protein [Lacisediminihabitans sp. FW035]
MDEVPAAFTIAFATGVTLTRWTRAWEERQRRIPLAFLPTDAESQVSALHEGLADVSFVRLPVDRNGLSIIPLYDEVAVVVVPKEHPVAAFDAVTLDDLAGEDLVPPTLSAEEAVELVAAGGGIVVLPQSIARLHTRKDVVARPVTDAAGTSIAIAWLEDRTTPQVEEFVGIVRGRTAASSRAVPTPKTEKPRKAVAPKARAPQRGRPRKSRGR